MTLFYIILLFIYLSLVYSFHLLPSYPIIIYKSLDITTSSRHRHRRESKKSHQPTVLQAKWNIFKRNNNDSNDKDDNDTYNDISIDDNDKVIPIIDSNPQLSTNPLSPSTSIPTSNIPSTSPRTGNPTTYFSSKMTDVDKQGKERKDSSCQP